MNWSRFFYMGGYGFYVWGSYLTALVCMGGEVLLLRRRKRNLEARLQQSHDLAGSDL
jgi:heme exporter protein D